MRRVYEVSILDKDYNPDRLLATIVIEEDSRVLAWGDEEVYFGNYVINTLLLNAQDDMINLSYVAYDEEVE
jgi:hypothetical protein